MAELQERLSKLSPTQWDLLRKRLRQAKSSNLKIQTIPRRPDHEIIPLSFAQESYWFLDQLKPNSRAGNRPLALSLTGPLDLAILRQTIDEILRRHEVLRVTISSPGGIPKQILNPPLSVDIPVIALNTKPPSDRSLWTERLVTEFIHQAFDLAKGPLVKAMLIDQAPQQHVLLLMAHHIAFDGWSAKVFIREFTSLYQAFSTNQPSPLPEPVIQFGDFAHWQKQRLQGEYLQSLLNYWSTKLHKPPCLLNLPTDHPRPATPSESGAHQSLLISTSTHKALIELSRCHGVTLFMTLLAAFQGLLHHYTGEEDLIIGSPIAGRTHLETEHLIGYFVNTLALRIDLSGNPSFTELLRRVRAIALEAFAHQDLPFEKLIPELYPNRRAGHSPLFQILFNMENVPEQVKELDGLRIEELDVETGISVLDLHLEITEKASGLHCNMGFSLDLFDPPTITTMLRQYQALLEEITVDPTQRLSDLPFALKAKRP